MGLSSLTLHATLSLSANLLHCPKYLGLSVFLMKVNLAKAPQVPDYLRISLHVAATVRRGPSPTRGRERRRVGSDWECRKVGSL